MTSRRTLGFVLALPLFGCGARADKTAPFERGAPAITAQPGPSEAPSSSAAPQVSQTSAPGGFIKPSPGPAPSGCCPPIVEQEPPPSSTPPTHPPSGEPPRPDAGAAPPASNACFEYLGAWITCEHAGEGKEERTSAPDVQSCMELCQQRPDCTAVTDYFWLGLPDLGCSLYTSTCNAPAGGVWQEEDGQRQYRKTCSTQ